MEVLRFQNFIDLDSSYKREVFRVDDFLDFTSDEFLDAPIINSDAKTNHAAAAAAAAVGCNKGGEAEDNKPGLGHGLEQVDIPDELEWLSNFVEDSSSIEDELPKHAFKSTSNEALKRTRAVAGGGTPVVVKGEDGSPASGLESSSTSGQVLKDQFLDLPATTTTTLVPGRARSKRSRAGTPNRKFFSYDILEATTPSSSSDYQEDSGAPSDPSSVLDDTGLFTAESNLRDERPPAAKKRKTSSSSKKQQHLQQQQQLDTGSSSSVQQTTQQKCLHCGSQKTPQWRAGPLGPKTLCNACGVRFKSGRLYPEYRPAASPSFVPQKHSNSHKRVLEMRKQKFDSEEAG